MSRPRVEDAHQALALGRIGERLSLGRDVERQLLLDQHEVRGVLVGGDGAVGGEAERARQSSAANRSASAIVGRRAGVSSAIRPGSRHSGSPSAAPVDARTPSAAPARPDTTCPGRSAAGRPGRSARAGGAPACRRSRAWSGRARRCSTRAPSPSSSATKVGSPPMLRRTSPAASSRIDGVAGGEDRLPLLVGVGLA